MQATTSPTSLTPTEAQNGAYQGAFTYLNKALFEGALPSPMLTFSRQAWRFAGYFSPGRWTDSEGNPVHEIAINANFLAKTQDVSEVFCTLIHEMAHLAQDVDPERFGKPGRKGYHSKAYCQLMDRIGFDCVGGGQALDTVMRPDGPAAKALQDMPEALYLPYQSLTLELPGGKPVAVQGEPGEPKAPEPKAEPEPGKVGTRVRFVCPLCGAKTWGKPGLRLGCFTGDNCAGSLMTPA